MSAGSWCSPRRLSTSVTQVHFSTPPNTPDLSIYSPANEWTLGNVPTWYSPDITLFQNAVYAAGIWSMPSGNWTVAAPNALMRNNSRIPAINVPVTFSWAVPGIGALLTPFGQSVIAFLPASGAVSVPFDYASVAGLAGGILPSIFVDIGTNYDANPNNNHGAMNTLISLAAVNDFPGPLGFPIRNSTAMPQTYTLAIVGANPLGAAFSAAGNQLTVPADSWGMGALDLPAIGSGQVGDITLIVTDSNNQLVGGMTQRLYVS